ncbi:hypothetical protein J5I95_21100 [Candidatus Poribacteria bacterium]|nr:hypothetical protein [Candidatus Poribacteria bacterium]
MCTIAASLVLSGCESDPILAPQSEVAEESGGSYGNTNLPVGGTNTTQNDVTDEQNGKTVGDRATITNPKRF